MRLTQLGLVAYGHFANEDLDLSDDTKSLHVIYGPNEAGKSTIKSAIEELLFEFRLQTPYSFKFGYNELKVAATISNAAGDILSFVRTRSRTNSLQAPDGTPLANDVLSPYLRGMTRDAFTTQFSLSREDMINGSDDIIKGKGEVGSSLYSAAQGKSFADIIKRLDAQAEEIYSRAKPLNKAIEAFDEARKEWGRAQIRPDTWKEQAEAQARVGVDIKTLNETLGAVSATIALLERLHAQAPAFARLLIIRDQLQTRASDIVVNPDQISRAEALIAQRDEAQRAIKMAADRIAELTQGQDDTSGEPLLFQSTKIRELAGQIEVYKKGLDDLATVGHRERAAQLHAEAGQLLDRVWPGLAPEEARDRSISTATAARGNELAIGYAGIKADLKTAQDGELRLQQLVDAAHADLAALPAMQDATPLRAAVVSASSEGRIDVATSQAQASIERHARTIETKLRSLGLFAGTIDFLTEAPLTQAETITRFRTDFDALRLEERSLKERFAESTKSHDDAVKALKELEQVEPLKTADDLIAQRTTRDGIFDELAHQWQSHAPPNDLDLTAARYRPAVVGADNLADELRLKSDRTARITQLQTQQGDAETASTKHQNAIDELAGKRAELTAAWDMEWSACDIMPRPPEEMATWLQSATEIRRAAEALADERSALGERLARRDKLAAVVRVALEIVGRPAPAGDLLEPILAFANDVLKSIEDTEADRTRLQNDIARSGREIAQQKGSGDRATVALATWKADWEAVLAASWLPETLPPVAFADTVALVERFRAADREAGILTVRANSIDSLNESIRDAVVAFMDVHAPDLRIVATTAPDAAMETLAECLAAAKTAHDKREERKELLEAQNRALGAATDEHTAATAALQTLADELAVPADQVAATISRAAETHALQKTFEIGRDDITSAIGLPLERCEEEYAGRDRAAIDGALGLAKEQLREHQADHVRLIEERRDLETESKRMDTSRAAADADAKLTAIGAKIDQESRRWTELTIARCILDQQIREYAENNQGPLVDRSGTYLKQVTGGTFVKLRVVADESKKVLEAVNASGTGIPIDGLSEGTRDQLYFALRLAALEQYFKKGEHQPLILDDAFVQFDDERTALAFAALAEFSKATQVLYFTHHRACVAAAQAAVPAERLAVHDLTARVHNELPAA